MEQHDGHIVCESEKGKGSEFRVYFPSIEFLEKTQEVYHKPINTATTETILLVEDELLVAELGTRILSGSGHNIIQSANGKKALEIFRDKMNEISLVVLDIMMPEMSGVDCLRELVKIDPYVKVVIATGFSIDAQTQEEIDPFVKGIVKKPFRISGLTWAVQNAIS